MNKSKKNRKRKLPTNRKVKKDSGSEDAVGILMRNSMTKSEKNQKRKLPKKQIAKIRCESDPKRRMEGLNKLEQNYREEKARRESGREDALSLNDLQAWEAANIQLREQIEWEIVWYEKQQVDTKNILKDDPEDQRKREYLTAIYSQLYTEFISTDQSVNQLITWAVTVLTGAGIFVHLAKLSGPVTGLMFCVLLFLITTSIYLGMRQKVGDLKSIARQLNRVHRVMGCFQKGYYYFAETTLFQPGWENWGFPTDPQHDRRLRVRLGFLVTLFLLDVTIVSVSLFENHETVGPTITSIHKQTVYEDGSTGPRDFVVRSAKTAPGNLVVSAISMNDMLIPNENLILTPTDKESGKWTIEAKPASNRHGTATILINVNDGDNEISGTFDVVVTPENDAPTITSIVDQTISLGATTGALEFRIKDVESTASILNVSARSSNPRTIPHDNLKLINLGNGYWSIEVFSLSDQQCGTVTIAITVEDGMTATEEQFDVIITP